MRISINEKLMQSIIEKAPLGFVLLDDNHNVLLTNEVTAKITGFSPEELYRTLFFSRLIKDKKTLQMLHKKLDDCINKPFDNVDVKITDKNGESVIVHIEGSAVKIESGQFIMLMLKDITHKKSFEKVMESSFDNFIQTTIALDNALQKVKQQRVVLDRSSRVLKDQILIAKNIQHALSGIDWPDNEYFEVGAQSRNCGELGKDYVDLFTYNHTSFGIILARTSTAGLLSLLVKTLLKLHMLDIVKTKKDPGQILSLLNSRMTKIIKDTGVSIAVLYTVIDAMNGTVACANAGHETAFVVRKEASKVFYLGDNNKGPDFGVVDTVNYTVDKQKLTKDAKIIFFTKGIVRTRNVKDEVFGKKRLAAYAAEYRQLRAKQWIKKVAGDLDVFSKAAVLEHDGTLVCIDVKAGKVESSRPVKAGADDVSAIDFAYTQGRRYIKEKQFRKALKEFFKVIEIDADSYGAYSYIGHIYGILEQHREAERFFKKAIDLNPEYFQGYYYLGIVLYNQKKYNEAKKYWLQLKTLAGEFKDIDNLIKKVT